MREKLGLGDGRKSDGAVGFKAIPKKSLHFASSRFRESLMEISMLTQENSLSNFVDNQEDIEILFTSMSPSVVEFFQNSFNKTRFTKSVKNLDWKLGDTLKVIGQDNSVITQELADKCINEGKPEAEEAEDI